MKTTIIYLGIVALSFANTIAANELKEQNFNKEQELTTVIFENSLQDNLKFSLNQQILKDIEGTESNDSVIFDPNSVIKASYENKIEEIIAENKLVTESIEEGYQPISLERTIEESIAEYSQIVEGKDTNEFYPLDFEKINRTIQCVKVSNNNATITIDLKL